MGNTPIAESLVGLFIVMAIVVTFRRKTPRAIELAVWIGLVWVCVAAIAGTSHPQARALTTATIWAAGQVAGTILDLFRQGALHALYQARFLIADWVVLLLGVDVLLLALVATKRQGDAWVPATKLRDWRVLPNLPTTEPAHAISAVDELNRRFNAWSAPVADAAVMGSTLFLIWLRDVEIPSATRRLANLAFPGSAATATWLTLFLIWLRDVQLPRAALGLKTVAMAARAQPPGTAESAPAGPYTVHINQLAEASKHKNVSKKHRQSRLAS